MDPSSLPPVEQMIVAARENVEKLGELLQRYRPFLTLRARYGLPEEMAHCLEASDLVQETMLDAAGGFCNFRGCTEPEFSKWIKEIQAHNLLDCRAHGAHAGGGLGPPASRAGQVAKPDVEGFAVLARGVP